MIRICSPQLGLSPHATRGGEVFDRELLRALAGLGARVEVLLPVGAPCPSVAGWDVRRLPLRRGYRWWVSNLVFVPYIGRAYRRHRFDVLRVHSLRYTGLAAVWARRAYRLPVPIVAHHHHVDPAGPALALERRIAAGVDLVITGSGFAQRQVVGLLGVAEGKTAVVRYGVAMPEPPSPPATVAREPLLLHVGSLIPRKRVPVLLAALRQVRKTAPQVRLVLLGTGPEQRRLQVEASRLGVGDAVDFVGAVSEEDKGAYLARAAVFVTASALEGFGLAVAEAMAAGVPVVAARSGAVPELLEDERSGLLVDPDHVEDVAAAIVRVLGDRDLACRLSTAARYRASAYPWDGTARRVLALYESLQCT